MSARVLALAVPLALSVACESISSTEVGTDAIYADLAATSDGTETRATATLRVGGATSNTFVNLEGDDILTVTADGETLEMTESYVGDIYVYDASFDVVAADTPFTFTLDRSLDAGAPDSSCSLPEPFTIEGPAADAVFSRGQDELTVTWTPSGEQDLVRVIVQGDCIWRAEVDVSGDPGVYVFEAGDILAINEDDPQACDATVTVERRRTGQLDAGYGEGGTIFGVQSRSVGIRSDP